MEVSSNIQIIENVLYNNYFQNLIFSDEREKNVFLSYIKAFQPIIFDSDIKKVLEIGSGQSTYLLAFLSKRINFRLSTIDMNPNAIRQKLRDLSLTESIINNINFITGFSISIDQITDFYNQDELRICNYSIEYILKFVDSFIDSSKDKRKENLVVEALDLKDFNTKEIIDKLSTQKKLNKNLLNIYRNENDEFKFKSSTKKGCLENCLKEIRPDLIFLDGGEFSSLPEWNIISKELKKGAYIILHDIFFPKSIKNWLVAAYLIASDDYSIIFFDKSTPQGLIVARKVK